MARVRLVHWDPSEAREQRQRLEALGHEAEFDALDGPALLRTLRANPPDAVVVDLSRRPSHGREVALALRASKGTRGVPIVFVGGEPEKVARVAALLPDAVYTSWGRLKTALPRAIATPPAAPVVPPSSIYSSKPAVEKLGITAGARVALLNAPTGFADTLVPMPARVRFTARPDERCDLFLAFIRSARELAAQLTSIGRLVDRQTLWIVWPKKTKASGMTSDLNGNLVRETGLAMGWVDFKICSVDEIWSGLAFKKRRR